MIFALLFRTSSHDENVRILSVQTGRALLAQVFVTTAVADIDVTGHNRLKYDLWKNYVPAESTALELKWERKKKESC